MLTHQHCNHAPTAHLISRTILPQAMGGIAAHSSFINIHFPCGSTPMHATLCYTRQGQSRVYEWAGIVPGYGKDSLDANTFSRKADILSLMPYVRGSFIQYQSRSRSRFARTLNAFASWWTWQWWWQLIHISMSCRHHSESVSCFFGKDQKAYVSVRKSIDLCSWPVCSNGWLPWSWSALSIARNDRQADTQLADWLAGFPPFYDLLHHANRQAGASRLPYYGQFHPIILIYTG